MAPEELEAEPAGVDLGVRLQIEEGERLHVIRCEPEAPRTGDARPRDAGPFGGGREGSDQTRADLLDELIRTVKARSMLAIGVAAGGRRGSWGPLTLACVPSDAPFVIAALAHLFDRDDDEPLREFLRRPPEIPRGTAWAPPDPR